MPGPSGTTRTSTERWPTSSSPAWRVLGIVIERDDGPALPAARERILVVTDTALNGDRIAKVGMPGRILGREGDLVLVNGQREPAATVAAGSYEHWRVVNACASRFLRLRLEGAELLQVAADVGLLAEPTQMDRVFLAPGNRAEVLVRAPEAGSYRLVTEPVDRGSAGMPGMMAASPAGTQQTRTLLNMEATGDAAQAPALPRGLAKPDDLRRAAVDGRRTLTLAMGMGRAVA